ncbi:thiol-disulfide oxidoreductase DCC family protein [Criblamydia sequanensis]|uniref:Thiol-disulphide oxidoreductase n=1 Tax=Candidatus Criblamydia sequanensis CRIB-18 TaxID=1437425 RepID=A0A090D166_9BACT|nr:DCC1-like thiol-disulfide oxidoreductase family protein [Criblamydia sequanensis]CDR35111.1 Putative thiol-disulphide oxidoreductase [Criblamydia sequanensis CRIB-18]
MADSPMKHLVFYDGECGFCDQVVQFLLKADKKRVFIFAPLQGKHAALALQDLPDEVKQADSIILIEDYQGENPKVYLFGKAVFRIFWLLGGGYKALGVFYFLPAWLYNFGYRFIAKHRKKIFKPTACVIPNLKDRDRFLD